MGLIMKNGIQYPGNASSGGESSYTLPIASTETLGGIKIGENLSITEDGTLNAEASGTSVLSPGAILYDTKEKVVGKWIDGKPIYEKVIYVDIVDRDWHNIQMDVSIDNIIKLKGILYRGDNYFMELQGNIYPNDVERGMVYYNKNDNYIKYVVLYSFVDLSSAYLYITIQYTKTTDEENSFNIGMVENINLEQNIDFSNIYSTDERIVGSWVNGKPVYQKVINLSETIVLQSYVWTNVFMIENMEKIIDIECIIGTVLNDGRLRWNCLNNYICGAAEEDNFTIDSCIIIIQYIKTTDEENSFTPDMIIDHENITDAEIADAAAADKI